MNRLTESETKKANMLASMIDCSPHEWPNSSHEIQLICHGYLDRVADNQNLCDRLAAVEAEADRLREDAVRNRWCEESQADVKFLLASMRWRVLWVVRLSEGYKLRQTSHADRNAAIDAAMRGGK